MKIVRVLSVVGLAAYLVFNGLFNLGEMESPTIHAAIGLLGLVSGALMFISLGHWIDIKKEK